MPRLLLQKNLWKIVLKNRGNHFLVKLSKIDFLFFCKKIKKNFEKIKKYGKISS